MRKFGLIPAALAAAFAAATGPAAAAGAAPAAPSVLGVLVGGGSVPAAPGDTLTASLTAGSIFSITPAPGGSTGLFCTSSTWMATILSNPGPSYGPAQLQVLPPWTVGSCFDSNPGVTSVTGVTVGNLPNILQVNGISFAMQLLPMTASTAAQITVTGVGGSAPFTCVYQVPIPLSGSAGPTTGPWKFTQVQVNLISAPLPQCGGVSAPSYFTASYGPVIDTTMGGGQVTVG
jgi:hypothetical protein